MSFTLYENKASLDDYDISFDRVPTEETADKHNSENRINKGWAKVYSDLNGLSGLSLKKPDVDAIIESLIKANTHAVMFELVLTKAELRLDVTTGSVTWKAGTVRVPTSLEDYRTFLGNLNGWSTSTRNIVPDADFKKFNTDNPKKPTFKTFDDIAKNKDALAAFRKWAAGNTNAKKAFEAIDKTAKAKPNDPARVAALKAINVSLQDYYKTFD